MSGAPWLRGICVVALVGCAHHAQRVGAHAAKGVKSQIAAVDPEVTQAIAENAARGVVTGTLLELEDKNQMLEVVMREASNAVARGIANAAPTYADAIQTVVDRASTGAVAALGRSLETDAAFRRNLAETSRQMSESAVYGARDALDLFSECRGAADRKRCIAQYVDDVSRAAARGITGGIVDALKAPMIAIAFVTGVLATLLVARIRRPRVA
jgi:hypothetical protein